MKKKLVLAALASGLLALAAHPAAA